MLGALSGVTEVVGEKIAEKTRKPIIATLLTLLASSEVFTKLIYFNCIIDLFMFDTLP